VLLAHEQRSNPAIAEAVGPSRNLVQQWRKRFALWEPSPLVPATAVALLARLEALLLKVDRMKYVVTQPAAMEAAQRRGADASPVGFLAG
jgi:hypothetical protein